MFEKGHMGQDGKETDSIRNLVSKTTSLDEDCH